MEPESTASADSDVKNDNCWIKTEEVIISDVEFDIESSGCDEPSVTLDALPPNPSNQQDGLDNKMEVAESYSCASCFKDFQDKETLAEHVERSCSATATRKNHKCSVCESTFRFACRLSRHMIVHSRIKLFNCHDCDKTFARVDDLQQHMVVHSEVRKYVCSDCKKTFARLGDLNSHKVVHSGVKRFTCTYCDKTFARSGGLRQHIGVHSRVKLYKCPSCRQSFRHRTGLSRHKIAVHSVTNSLSSSPAASHSDVP